MDERRTLLIIDHKRNCVEVSYDDADVYKVVENLNKDTIVAHNSDKEVMQTLKNFLNGDDICKKLTER